MAIKRGKVLSCFWELNNRVLEFLTEIDELPAERGFLVDGDWQNDLACLVDITAQLNALNVQLQRINKLFTNMYNYMTSFQMRLQLFVNQISQGNLDNFDHLKAGQRNTRLTLGIMITRSRHYVAFSIPQLTNSRQMRITWSCFQIRLRYQMIRLEDQRRNCSWRLLIWSATQFWRTDLRNFQQFPCGRHDFILKTFTSDGIWIFAFFCSSFYLLLWQYIQARRNVFCDEAHKKTKSHAQMFTNLGDLMLLTTTNLQLDIAKLSSSLQPHKSH